MRPTLLALKKTASSARWLARQSRDPYVKDRISDAGVEYRSRSSFKLVSLLEKFPQLLARHDLKAPATRDGPDGSDDGMMERPGARSKVVVDLGAAPGGWSQVIRRKLRREDLIFALDILDMEPISGVEVLRGDFLDLDIQQRLRQRITSARNTGPVVDWADNSKLDVSAPSGLVDLVLSDMMGSMSGNRLANIRMSLDLVEAATTFAFANLKSGKDFISPSDSKGGHLV